MNATIFIVIPILTLLMFELGLNLKVEDFKLFKYRPKPVLAGLIGQIVVLPALAWLIGWALHLEPVFLIGFVLIACCPGGSSSNVFSMIAKGDVALSVSLTACSSIIYHEEIKSGSTHEILAKVIDYDEETKIATIESRNAFDVGDYMEILSPITENVPFRIEWIENENGERVDKSRNPMDILRIPLEHKVRKEDILRTYRKEE